MRHSLWRDAQWRRVVWSDAASFNLSSEGRVRHELPQRYVAPATQGGEGRLLVKTAIWIGGRSSIHIMDETMNSERYVFVLENYVLPLSFTLGDPASDWLYMDDNATPHRSALTNEFKRLMGLRTLEWPARSRHLNAIENI